MNRPLAFAAALVVAAISVSSACMAGPLPDTINFGALDVLPKLNFEVKGRIENIFTRR